MTEDWKCALDAARERRSEPLFRALILLMEQLWGEASTSVGLCLVDYANFLESEGRILECERVTDRYHNILRLAVLRHDLYT